MVQSVHNASVFDSPKSRLWIRSDKHNLSVSKLCGSASLVSIEATFLVRQNVTKGAFFHNKTGLFQGLFHQKKSPKGTAHCTVQYIRLGGFQRPYLLTGLYFFMIF